MNCIGSKRGITGIVYDEKGRKLGKVFPTNRRLREDMGGGTGRAWTADVYLPDGTAAGALGTRHADRWSAARAIRAFWDAHEELLNSGPFTTWAERRPIHQAVALFKYDHHDVCGLLARYRGADPRSYMKDAA